MTTRAAHDITPAAARRPAAAYLRASTKRQHLSCDDQARAIEAYCVREGLQLVRTFRDDGVSGTRGRGRRAAWDELLDFVEAGHLAGGVVVVWSMDRWSRDFRAGLLAAWTVGDYQVELHTTDGGRVDLDSVEGQLMGTLKLALAAQESRERGRRVRERKALHLAAGHWPTRPPYGYVLDGPRGRKVLRPRAGEAETVRLIYQLYDQGLSLGQISAELRRREVLPRSGQCWSPASLQRILAGWSYGGIARSRDGSARPVACETFIARDLWERCRVRAEAKGGQRPRRPRYPLSGLVICGVCGRRMRVHSWPTRSGGVRRGYRCPGREVRDCTNRTVAHVERLEASVLAWWRGLATGQDLTEIAAEAVRQEHAEAIAASAARRPIEQEIRELDDQELRLVDAIRQTGLSPIISRELEIVRRRRAELGELAQVAGAVMLLVLSGCATYSQLYVNSAGDVVTCSATGQGLIGMATAANAAGDCGRRMLSAGYVEIERAGVVGIRLSDTAAGEAVRVLMVATGSPAAAAGVLPGDTITEIAGQPISSKIDAGHLLFGMADTEVGLTLTRSGEAIDLILVRAPYTEVYGVPSSGKKSGGVDRFDP